MSARAASRMLLSPAFCSASSTADRIAPQTSFAPVQRNATAGFAGNFSAAGGAADCGGCAAVARDGSGTPIAGRSVAADCRTVVAAAAAGFRDAGTVDDGVV